jgi:hypothetical protein
MSEHDVSVRFTQQAQLMVRTHAISRMLETGTMNADKGSREAPADFMRPVAAILSGER